MGLSLSPGSVSALDSQTNIVFLHFFDWPSFIIADDRLVDKIGQGSDPLVLLLGILRLSLPQLPELPCLLELALLGHEDHLAIFIMVELGLDQVRLIKDLGLLFCAVLGC